MVKLSPTSVTGVSERVAIPDYDPASVTAGIVHFGVGNFHRSHEAMFMDRILSRGSTEWGICGVGVLASDARMRDVLADQGNLYTLITKRPDATAEARVIGSIVEYLFAPNDIEAVLTKLASRSTHIVSLTITEGGYSINNATGAFEPGPAILEDLERETPTSVLGFLTEGLRRRRDTGIPPFTVMSCDNIQGNGHVARIALTAFAALRDEALGQWIAENVRFPNSMVDRITPITTPQTISDVAADYGIDDAWPVASESFVQWVLEDDFSNGRPDLESVGVQLVADVEPYELVKLRLLNASHQMMSYLGLLAGYSYVHEVCRTDVFSRFLLDYMHVEAIPTLRAVPGIELDEYCNQLIARFSSEAIADTLARQVVDASERMPKFVLPVVRAQLASDGPVERAALAVAAWSLYLQSVDAAVVNDVRTAELLAAVERESVLPGAFLEIADVFGDLGTDARFRADYVAGRALIQREGAIAAIQSLA